jgi:hypothetical protein
MTFWLMSKNAPAAAAVGSQRDSAPTRLAGDRLEKAFVISGSRAVDQLRIFLSSPGDVADERALARSLIKEDLPYDPFLRGRITFDVVSWDDPAAPIPMEASITPQEAVNRFGPEPCESDIVVIVLWSRLGTHLDLKAFQKGDGTQYRSGTEWEFENALNAPQPNRPAILVYRRMEEPKIGAYDPKRTEKLHQADLVEEFFRRFQNPDGSLRGGWAPYHTPTEFKDRLAKDLRQLLSERLRSKRLVVGGTVRTGSAAPVWSRSPYPGLRSFRADEAPIFFGRAREVDALVSHLRDPAQRFLAVVGASGSGKSSLIYAGLIPRLAAGAIEGSQHWSVLAFTPGASGDNPLLALASELKGMLPTPTQRAQIEIATILAKSSRLPRDYVDALLEDRPSTAVVMLLIDQFEELLTHAAEQHRRTFIDFLAQVANEPRVRVLATMRADFLPQCAAEPALAGLLQAGTFVLGAPGFAALADMIKKPAERAGLEIEPALIDNIVMDAGGEPGQSLPLIAFCLEELYEQTAPEHV